MGRNIIDSKRVCLIATPCTFLFDPVMYPPIGLLYIASVLEQEGYEVLFMDLRTTSQLETVQFPHVKYYGLTATTTEINSAVKIKNMIKAQNPQSVVFIGGAHATVKPEEMINEFDAVIVGEGEKSVFKVLQGARGIIKSSPIEDINTIPYPARHLLTPDARFSSRLFEGQKYGLSNIASTLTSTRGCPFNCAFCASPTIWNRKIRFRSPENFVGEIKQLIENYGCRNFKFIDDNFSFNRSRLFEIVDLMEPLNIRFRFHTRVSLVDEEILAALKRAGCNEVAYGIETPDDYILEKLHKGETREREEHALRITKDVGFLTRLYLMICLPYETWDTIQLTKEFITRNKDCITKYTLSTMAPYPGTDIYNNPENYDVIWMEKDYDKLLAYEGTSLIATTECSQEELTEHRTMLSKFLIKTLKWPR